MSHTHHSHHSFKQTSQNTTTGPSPLPTPPTSSVNIPPKCFPSPTSIADLATDNANTSAQTNSNNTSSSTTNPTTTTTTSNKSHNKTDVHIKQNQQQQQQTSKSTSIQNSTTPPISIHHQSQQQQQQQHHHHHQNSVTYSNYNQLNTNDEDYYFPQLINTNPSPPLDPVNNTLCLHAAQQFAKFDQDHPQATQKQLINQIRLLFDHIDALSEQPQMEIKNLVFKTLSKSTCLSLLPVLLADVSAQSTHQVNDIRKTYRYSSVATIVLETALPHFREKLLAHKTAIQHIFSFFDGQVVQLGTQLISNTDQHLPLAREDPTILSAVVKILVTYTGASPDTIIDLLQNRSQFMPAVISLLHMPFVSQVITSFIPDHCIDDVNRMDWARVQFDKTMTNALSLLAKNQIYHLLSQEFLKAALNVFNISMKGTITLEDEKSISRSHVVADTICQLYVSLVNKTIRAVRVNPTESSCIYLNLFANNDTAETFGVIVQSALELFSATNGKYSSIFDSTLKLISEILQNVQQDKERRVTSVKGQPPLLDMSAIEEQLIQLLQRLIDILVDILKSRTAAHMQIRLHIMEIIADCTAVCSETVMRLLDTKRIGEILWKVMIEHPKHSMIHHIIMRCAETGLVSESATEVSRWHWMIRCDLIMKVSRVWNETNGDQVWKDTSRIHMSPFMSAVIHIACCIQHWLAMETIDPLTLGHGSLHNSQGGCTPSPGPTYQKLVELDRLKLFQQFADHVLRPICEQEKPLGGSRPSKSSSRARSGLGRTLSLSALSGPMSRRQGGPVPGNAQLIPSLCAHRFGYVPPAREGRSQVDMLFSDGEDDFGTGEDRSFTSIFGGSDALE